MASTKIHKAEKKILPNKQMFANFRRKKPHIKFLNNQRDVQITFPNGTSIVVREDDTKNMNRINVDDHITRQAYNMNDLNQTSHLPRSIICPITRLPLNDPVLCADGYSYERREIVKWLKKSKMSPYTGAELQHFYLTPNHTLRNTISEMMNSS